MCKCTTSNIKTWRYTTKRSRVWQSLPLWKTMGDLPIFSQTRRHGNPPVLWDTEATPSRWLLWTTWLVTLPVFRMQPHWPVANHTLKPMYPNNIFIWTYFNCLGKIDYIKILVSDKTVLLIWVYLDNRTWFAGNNTRHPQLYADMLPT